MTLAGRKIPTAALMWFGLFGSPGACIAAFALGFLFDQAQCTPIADGGTVPVDELTIAVTTVAAIVAVAAGACAVVVYLATKGMGDGPPPESRIHFLAVIGMTITPLFLAIILMSGLGSAFLESCHQS